MSEAESEQPVQKVIGSPRLQPLEALAVDLSGKMTVIDCSMTEV